MSLIRRAPERFRPIFFLSLYAAYAYVLFFVCELSDGGNWRHDAVRLLLPLAELGCANLLCALGLRLAQRRRTRWPLVAAVAAGGLVYVVYLGQIVSLALSDNFISVLALQNTDSSGFVTSPALALAGAAAVLYFAAFAGALVLSARASSAPRGAARWSGRRLAAAIALLLLANARVLAMQSRTPQLEAAFWQVPAANLAHNLYLARFASADFGPAGVAGGAREAGGGHCFPFPAVHPGGPGYPFMKDTLYRQPLGATGEADKAPLNAIVIFAEGTSARLIGAYGGRYPGLTPNIDRLARRSMRVTDYYNHTAATYRALIGQLSSGFPYAGGGGAGGWEKGDNEASLSVIRRQTLPRLLGRQGYRSYFFSPHPEQRPFTAMLRSLGFDQVYTYQSIGEGLLDGHFRTRDNTGALEDASLFRGITRFLQRRTQSGASGPFFVAAYNIGTHAFIDINDHGDQPYGDGSKAFLNKLHTFDAAFGRFLDWFYASPYAADTVLVFTADHATYPDPTYRAVAGPDLKPYFVDRIPLLVLDPRQRLPSTLDAHGRNSLALAPTLAQLLGVRRAPNSFLGHSLFEPRSFPIGIAALGGGYFATTPGGVYAADELPDGMKRPFGCEVRVVVQYYRAERANRLFGPPETTAGMP